MHTLLGNRDKIAVSLATNMFSISDTFTCCPINEFIPRNKMCEPDSQNIISDYILVSTDTSLRNAAIKTPNASTDGSFAKTRKYENGARYLYKLQGSAAVYTEREISKALVNAGFDACEYEYCGRKRNVIKSRNFLNEDEFFEPYESFRYCFNDRSDDEEAVYNNLSALGPKFERMWRDILLSDALFMNTDRHLRNFGVIRSCVTGEVIKLAPNFDNNHAYKANPAGKYSNAMLKAFDNVYKLNKYDKERLASLVHE